MLLWAKALHLIFMVTWFCGLFYLPRLFVYHAMATDAISIQRFKLMERKLYFGIMTPGAIFTIIFGSWLISLNAGYYLKFGWIHAKISLVALLIVYHLYLGKLLFAFKRDENKHSHVFYRILNEVPVIFLVAIILLAVIKPF
jgi:protoporphyrinogen IX oxidase